MSRYTFLALLFALAVPSGAAGETTSTSNPTFLDGVTVAEMEAIMSKAGYQAKVGVDNENKPIIDSKASGLNFWVYFYNCEGDQQRCRRVQFETSLKTDKTMQDKALDWNNKKVAGRATNNKDNTYFDYLIDCGGGVSADNLSQNLERFDTLMSEFTTFIGWH